MPSQRTSIELSKVAPQPTGVPADYVDPNHPYFPHDPEAQLQPRSFAKADACVSSNWFLIVFSLIPVLGLLIASMLIGIKIGISKCPHEQALVYETTIMTSTSMGSIIRVTPDPT
ncbi:hypothetical protein G6011_05186 [Alternaria panax]|uniref:Uncharacterized protein n=1 Tax=Alternaria panax TaxID=48097 RepID=A0AAD4FCA1_9PLEO|nr:hypothetical protein G6011_05186 [Alternaria panax]